MYCTLYPIQYSPGYSYQTTRQQPRQPPVELAVALQEPLAAVAVALQEPLASVAVALQEPLASVAVALQEPLAAVAVALQEPLASVAATELTISSIPVGLSARRRSMSATAMSCIRVLPGLRRAGLVNNAINASAMRNRNDSASLISPAKCVIDENHQTASRNPSTVVRGRPRAESSRISSLRVNVGRWVVEGP